MDDDLTIREYLRAPKSAFWEWRDAGEAIVWKDNRTIAFRSEVAQVLRWLAPQGLPPLSALLLLLAATRHSWRQDRAGPGILAGILQGLGPEQLLNNVLAGLDKIADFDEPLRAPIAAKRVLIEMVLQGTPRVVEGPAALAVVEALEREIGEYISSPDDTAGSGGGAPALLTRDLHLISAGMERLSAETLRLRIETGIEEKPRAAPVELTPSEVARQLIRTLQDEAELAGVGQIAKRLESIASLPRRLSAKPERELGGYSDIANRGALDRLLVSELAHDNLTLAVRVAMNEALYLCRESPPSLPRTSRRILLDAGITMWGVPRIFATAAALAFAASAGKNGQVDFYCAIADKAAPADLLSAPGITQQLTILEPDLHPAAALASFLGQATEDDVQVEPILLTSPQALATPEMQEALRRLAPPRMFLATVDRSGAFRLLERTPQGCKQLRQAAIDLADITSAPKTLVDRSREVTLPAICSTQPFPLLLSHPVRPSHTWWSGSWGALSLTNDGRLMRWAEHGRGAIQLAERLPLGKLWWASQPNVDDEVTIVVGSPHKVYAVRVGREGMAPEAVPLQLDDFGPIGAVCAHGDAVFVCRKDRVAVVDTATGRLLSSLNIPFSLRWRHGRFFRSLNNGLPWYALAHDGRLATFEAVPIGASVSHVTPILFMFEHHGGDGPVGVTSNGQFYLTAKDEFEKIYHHLTGDVRVVGITQDGKRLCLSAPRPKVPSAYEYQSVNFPFGKTHACTETVFDERVERNCKPLSLRHRVSAIGVDSSGKLALRSQKGHIVSFQFDHGTPTMTTQRRVDSLRRSIEFAPVEGRFGYDLSVARFTDGGSCFLDSRGLLHFMPADRSEYEVTIVLHEGQLTGWRSDGQTWGRAYFTNADARAASEDSDARAREICAPLFNKFAQSIDV